VATKNALTYPRCDACSYFESYEEEGSGLPVLRVFKELVHCT
jgi:hypothetical protein